MDIVKLSTDWAKAEVFSAKIVWLFSTITIIAALGFWFWGRTGMARAFTWPLLVAGIFLVAVGAGLYFANSPRITRFETEYSHNPETFLQGEILRTAESKKESLPCVFKILPAIIIFCCSRDFIITGQYLESYRSNHHNDCCFFDDGGQ